MKVVGIVGSPRSNGNTEHLVRNKLDEITKQGIETELVTLHDKKINYCTGCDYCKKNNECHIDDDMKLLTKKVKDADGIIMSSPVYFGDMSGLAKSFIDRLRPLRNIHAFKYKVCGALSCGGFRIAFLFSSGLPGWLTLFCLYAITTKKMPNKVKCF